MNTDPQNPSIKTEDSRWWKTFEVNIHQLKSSLSSFEDDRFYYVKMLAKYQAKSHLIVKSYPERLWEDIVYKMKFMKIPGVIKWGIRKGMGLVLRIYNVLFLPFRRTDLRLIEMDHLLMDYLTKSYYALSSRINNLEREVHFLGAPAISGNPYLEFENLYRGSPQDVEKKCLHYFDFLKLIKSWSKQDEVLDIGCGRGEFLNLVRTELGCQVLGVDTNSKLKSSLEQQSIPFVSQDCFEYLETTRDKFSLISAIHLIEHLPKVRLPFFLQKCVKALKLGGILILEWPNITTLSVSGDTFELDPTHVARPHPLYVRTLLSWYGMEVVKELDLSPREEFKDWEHEPKDSREYKLAYKIFGSQDKVLISQKINSGALP